MVALYQTSTLASWTSIAYTSYWGCATWLGDPYGGEPSSGGHASRVETPAGSFDGFRCDLPGLGKGNAALASVFFPIYIVLTAWVIMSLFIGVISNSISKIASMVLPKFRSTHFKRCVIICFIPKNHIF